MGFPSCDEMLCKWSYGDFSKRLVEPLWRALTLNLTLSGLNFSRCSIKYARLKPVAVMPPKNGACSDITDSKLNPSLSHSLFRSLGPMAPFGCRDGV